MQIKTNILPIGGMNKDDDPRHFEQGDYLDSRNMRIGSTNEQGDDGLIQNIKSTLEIALPDLGTIVGINHLGKVVDEENDLVFIFVYVNLSSNDKFTILKHNIKTNIISVIFSQLASDWGITIDMRFYNPVIVNNCLIWTDNVNNVRMMDVNRIEQSMLIGLKVNDDSAIAWDTNYAFNTGYTAGQYVNYYGNLFLVLASTIGQPVTPSIFKNALYNFIDGKVKVFNSSYGFDTGYDIGTYVCYLDKVYLVIQETSGIPNEPPNAPSNYTYKCQVVDCYLDVSTPNYFSLAALPPLISITPSYETNSTISVNKLKGRTFQFSYRYIYMDWRKSTYASPSIVAVPQGEEDINGNTGADPSLNNQLNLAIYSGNKEVRVIEVIARDSDDPTTWYKIDEIILFTDTNSRAYESETTIGIKFINNESRVIVDQVEVYTPFSYVPVRAKHMELIENNRLVFGNITEGYGKINSSVLIQLSYTDLASVTTQRTALALTPVVEQKTDNYLHTIKVALPQDSPGEAVFKLALRKGYMQPPNLITFSYNGTDLYPDTVRLGLINAFIAVYGIGEAAYGDYGEDQSHHFYIFPRYTETISENPYTDFLYEGYYDYTIDTNTNKYPVLSKGFTHSWGIIYKDNVGRTSPIIGGDKMIKYIPFSTENNTVSISTKPSILFNINHVPPSWAESYEIVYSGNNTVYWFLQLIGYKVRPGKVDHTNKLSFVGTNNTLRMKVSKAQALCRAEWDNWRVEEYSWQKGDRMKIIGTIDTNGVLTEFSDAIYDTEITGIYDDTDYVVSPFDPDDSITEQYVYFKKIPSLTLAESANIFFEIYRTNNNSNSDIYFTTGMTFNIGVNSNGNKYHYGNTNQVLNTNGTSMSPAIITNTSHDAWMYTRNFRNHANTITSKFWVESQFPTDWHESLKLTSSGFPIADIDNLKQNILTKRLRHGGALNIGTQINNISKFIFDDFLDLKDQYGAIEGIRFIGFTLKVLQYIKVSSIFIGRQESFNAGGEADYQFTNNIFGTSRPNEENWGTSHPESVTVCDRYLYYWDQSEGIVVRNAANGQIAISEAKMKRYFADLAKTLDAEDFADQIVIFSYSKETDELFCMFGIGSAQKEIVTFSEKQKRWKTIIDLPFNLGQFYWIGKQLFHTNGESIFEWWKGSDYMNIGDNLVEGKISFYANNDPAKIKTFDSLIIYQNGARPIFESIIVPEKSSAVSAEMKSYIYDVNINEKEGVYYCQINRDINDPDPKNATENAKLMNGRRLRGIFANIIMKFTATTKITLSNIIALTTPSERSQ